MQKIIECVPNFSEGRNLKVIREIFKSAEKIKSARVFELEYNKDHNRCLFTIVGAPSDVSASVFEAIKTAAKLIDMNKHHGEHPRIGAADVIPFIPVSGVSIKECVLLSNKLAKKVADELKIPVFMYEASAKKPENRNLANVRKGEYEGLKERMSRGAGSGFARKKPDYGPNRIHPTAGATVIGARKYLIAFNVNLDTPDMVITKKIASKIREKDGGLKGVKALGFSVGGHGQVSMNLVDFGKTNFDEAYRVIEKEARKLGVKIKNAEIYGMIPLEALVCAVRTAFKADTFKSSQVLEKRLYE
ncbi:MAG: glutamate formimidoyltransferase [bacterium]|nr:glutamate formimidoyltransferase [bacterium]